MIQPFMANILGDLPSSTLKRTLQVSEISLKLKSRMFQKPVLQSFLYVAVDLTDYVFLSTRVVESRFMQPQELSNQRSIKLENLCIGVVRKVIYTIYITKIYY